MRACVRAHGCVRAFVRAHSRVRARAFACGSVRACVRACVRVYACRRARAGCAYLCARACGMWVCVRARSGGGPVGLGEVLLGLPTLALCTRTTSSSTHAQHSTPSTSPRSLGSSSSGGGGGGGGGGSSSSSSSRISDIALDLKTTRLYSRRLGRGAGSGWSEWRERERVWREPPSLAWQTHILGPGENSLSPGEHTLSPGKHSLSLGSPGGRR